MRRRGQSTLEYVIVLAVVISVITLVARNALRTNLEGALNGTANRIGTEAAALAGGR